MLQKRLGQAMWRRRPQCPQPPQSAPVRPPCAPSWRQRARPRPSGVSECGRWGTIAKLYHNQLASLALFTNTQRTARLKDPLTSITASKSASPVMCKLVTLPSAGMAPRVSVASAFAHSSPEGSRSAVESCRACSVSYITLRHSEIGECAALTTVLPTAKPLSGIPASASAAHAALSPAASTDASLSPSRTYTCTSTLILGRRCRRTAGRRRLVRTVACETGSVS